MFKQVIVHILLVLTISTVAVVLMFGAFHLGKYYGKPNNHAETPTFETSVST